MHLRLVVSAPDKLFPNAMIPIGDRAGAVELVVDSDAIYVMDHGYDDYARMDQWIENNIKFVIRMRDRKPSRSSPGRKPGTIFKAISVR